MHGSHVLFFKLLYAGSLFFSKNTGVFCILECYIHGSPRFAESPAVNCANSWMLQAQHLNI